MTDSFVSFIYMFEAALPLSQIVGLFLFLLLLKSTWVGSEPMWAERSDDNFPFYCYLFIFNFTDFFKTVIYISDYTDFKILHIKLQVSFNCAYTETRKKDIKIAWKKQIRHELWPSNQEAWDGYALAKFLRQISLQQECVIKMIY